MVKYTPCSSCGWNKSILEPTVQLDQGLTREHYIKRQQLFIPTTRISNFTYYETNPGPFQSSHQICSKIFKKNIFPSSHSNVNKYTPQSLTWNLKMMVSKRNLLFQGLIFRFHAKLQGCKCPTPSSSPTLVQASKLVLLRFQVPRPENFTKLRSVTLDETYWLFIWLFHRDPDDGLLYYTIIPILLCSITPEITPLTARLFFSLLISPPKKKKTLA